MYMSALKLNALNHGHVELILNDITVLVHNLNPTIAVVVEMIISKIP